MYKVIIEGKNYEHVYIFDNYKDMIEYFERERENIKESEHITYIY